MTRGAHAFALLAALIVASTALAGCHGLENDNGTPGPGPTASPSPTSTPTGSPGPTSSPSPTNTPPPRLDITITPVDAPPSITVDDTISIEVNVTGDAGTTTHAGAHFAYNSTADREAEELVPGDFDGASPHLASFSFPGNYTIENWTISDNRTIYVRAHILVGAHHYWSDEFVIAVNDPDANPPVSEREVVLIEGLGQAALCGFDRFQQEGGGVVPSNVTELELNGEVEWLNNGGCAHTATYTSGPVAFDTGDIPQGESSGPILFTVPGTYYYDCDYHPDMKGQINVAAT